MQAKLIGRTIQSLVPGSCPYDVRDTELQGFILRVQPTGAMSYFCEYRRPDGRRTRIKLGDIQILTPAQARDEALKILGDRARGEDPASVRQAAHQDTLSSFIEKHYRPWVEAHRKTGTQTVTRTLARFHEFKGQRLSDISPWKIEKWRSARLKAGIAKTTVNRNVTMLKAILQKAVEWDLIENNPLVKVRPLRTDQSAKVRFLDFDEEQRLRAALDQRESRLRAERRKYNQWLAQRGYPAYPNLDECVFADYLKPMVLISINTGIRRGELFDLTWNDVDFQRKTITINGITAKSGKTRHIPLNKEAFGTLQRWKTHTNSDKLVFSSANGHRFDNIARSWEALLDLAEIKDFRWHDLRHHFASLLVMNGVDLNTVRELLGHGDLKMTLRYAHLAPQIKADAVAKLDLRRTSLVDPIGIRNDDKNTSVIQSA